MAQEVSFTDETLISKIQPKFKFQDGEKSVKKRILFLSQKLVKDTIHVIQDNGFIKCLADSGQDCPACNSGNFKKARYGVHILEYATDQNGKVLNPFSYQVKAFAFAKGTAEKLQNLFVNMGEQFQKLDVIVACENPTYQLLNFTPVIDVKGSAFSQQPEEAKKAMREDIKKQVSEIDLSEIIARVVDEKTMSDMLSGKIKTYTPKTQAATPVATSAATPAASAAQAALPLTVVPATTAAPAPVAVVTTTPAQADASKMMDELAI